MTSLIIKSKIWNKSTTPLINYKDKNYLKQKISIERTGIISRRKDKIVFKQTENLNTSNNSSENTNYMNEPRTSELISIEKRENDSSYYINCGDWPKDLIQLIDQNAVYFLYKGLTIENFLKEKQKYYVLNQGDIIKLGKIYLKILHIKLSGSSKKDDEDEKDKANATTDKEHSDMNKKVVSESESNSDDNNSENNSENEENECESNIKNDIKKEEDEDKKSEPIKRNYFQFNTNPNEYNRKNYKKEKENENESNYNNEYSAISNNFSYKRKTKNKGNNSRYNRLNRSFNGNLSDDNLDQLIKENINRNRSMSFTLKKSKNKFPSLSINSFYKINNNNLNESPKKKIKKKRKNSNSKKNKKEDNDIHTSPIKKEKSLIIQKEREKDKETIKPQEKKEKGKICRICLSGEDSPVKNPLICPCTCKGSMKFIHYFCLKNWLNLKIESDLGYGRDIETEQPTITYSTKDIACELCKTKLPDYIKHKGKIYNVSFYKPKYNKFIVLESIRDDTRRTKFIHIIPLNRRQIIKIGRLNNCDLSLPDFSISRVHCCMYIESGQLFLENNSKFGTKILVQTPKLLMSPQYPLCIEVQKTYLKLRIQKPFSLFSCCNVYTTSMTKMLVYQKQNEKGFDLFCSMVFKEDDGEEEEDDEMNINNINNNNEDLKNNENNKNENDIKDKISNKDDKSEENKKLNISKKMTNKSEDGKKIEYKLNKNMDNKPRGVVKNNQLKDKVYENKNELLKETELIDNNENDKKDENKVIDKNDDKKSIIKEFEDKKSVKDNYNDKKIITKNKKEELTNNISNEIKEEKNNREKEDSKEIIIEKKNEIIRDKKKVENMNTNNNKINIENQNKSENKEKDINLKNNKINSEYKLSKSKTIQKDFEKEDIKDIIDTKFKMNGRRSIQKNEIKNNTNLIETKFKNFEKKIMKKTDEKETIEEKKEGKKEEKKEEKIIQKIKEEKKEGNGKLLEKQYSLKNKEKKNEEIKIKKELNRKETINIKNEINKEEEQNKKKEEQKKIKNKINNLETEEPKANIRKEKDSINIEKEKEKHQVKNEDKTNKMKSESKMETKQIKLENEKKININFETDDIKYNLKENKDNISEYNKSIHSESYRYNTKRKFHNKSIDLNAINDLSYKQGQQEELKNKNSALDNYQSIFGLMPSKQNETALLLAPKHTKNKNLKHFDLNINNEQMNDTNKSNVSWSKYTSQYEENKRMKNI